MIPVHPPNFVAGGIIMRDQIALTPCNLLISYLQYVLFEQGQEADILDKIVSDNICNLETNIHYLKQSCVQRHGLQYLKSLSILGTSIKFGNTADCGSHRFSNPQTATYLYRSFFTSKLSYGCTHNRSKRKTSLNVKPIVQ